MSSIAEALKRAERERMRVVNLPSPPPMTQAPPMPAQQQTTETIVEDVTAKRQLNLPTSLVVYHERAGRVAEQYRRIRDALMMENDKREPQMLVITSAVAGEGKTITVLNLGLSLVEIRANRVLLIDGNMHASKGGGSLSRLLRLQKQRGLVEMLSTDEGGGEQVTDFIQATPWHHLYVLPTKVQKSGGELLRSPKLRMGLRTLRSRFDWVLIDSPAAEVLPDAGILGECSDGIMITVAMHRTSEERVRQTLRRLRSMNLPVKSCILTRQ